jgi:hypothetical protein
MKYKFLCLVVAAIVWALPQTINAQVINFDLFGAAGSGLLPGNENPSVAGNSTASGDAVAITFDTTTNELSLDVVWGSGNGFSDLTGTASAIHIHGPAGINENGGVLYNLGGLAGFDSSATSGGLTGSIAIDAADVQTLLNGDTYLNIHTADNPGGELRGNLLQAVPEPSTVALLGLLGTIGLIRRNR